jgi:large subunit ribosomal protein L21
MRFGAELFMYAIFEDGSRQYRVSEGDLVRVDYREVAIGARIEFPRVLLYADGADVKVGQPTVDGMRVLGTVVSQPSVKVFIQYFRRRKHYRRLKGHRQHHVELKVTNILLPGQATPPLPEPPAAPVPPALPADATAAPMV